MLQSIWPYSGSPNYDVPFDGKAYVHRIGRTGRAGRSGDVILFLTPRERRFLGGMERAVGQPIEPMDVPSNAAIHQHRLNRLHQRLAATVQQPTTTTEERALLSEVLQRLGQELDCTPSALALAALELSLAGKPLLLKAEQRWGAPSARVLESRTGPSRDGLGGGPSIPRRGPRHPRPQRRAGGNPGGRRPQAAGPVLGRQWPENGPLADFPRGAAAGDCLHRILEGLDYSIRWQVDGVGEQVSAELRRAGLASQPLEPLLAGLEQVRLTPFGGALRGLRLADLTAGQWLNEMNFDLTLGSVRAKALADAFADHPGGPFGAEGGRLEEQLVGTPGQRGPARGLCGPSRYDRGAMTTLIAANHYPLQAHLYLVALHRYLGWRQPGYQPERDLGGYAYVFLRGAPGPVAPQDWDAGVAGISPDIPGMVVEGPPSVVCWPSMGPWRRRSEGHDFQPGFQRGSLAAGELECPLPPLLQQGQGLAQADGPDSLARLQRSALVQASDSPLVLQGQRLAWRRWQQRLQQVLDALNERAQPTTPPRLAGCGRGDRASSGDPSRSTPCRPP